jgi:hypothetical protein
MVADIAALTTGRELTGRWAHSTEVRHAARNSNDNQHIGLPE